MNYNLLPKHLKASVWRYIEERQRPECDGGFLQAVICNNLVESYRRIDKKDKERLLDIIAFFYHEAPGNCWGSPEKMEAWLDGKK